MKIRRFYSHNVRSALKQVTEAFGDDAAILSNKKVAGGVEIIAALDYDEDLMPSTEIKSSGALNDTNQDNNSQVKSQHKAQALPEENTSHSQSLGPNRHTNQFSQENLADQNQADVTAFSRLYRNEDVGHIDKAERQSINQSKLEWSLDPSLRAMKEELELMRSMMSEQLKGIAWNRFTEKDPLKAMIMRRLSGLGLNSEILSRLLPHIDTDKDAECCWQKMLATLAKSLPIANDDILDVGGTYAFIGPTGVGKTTTIAKLAARFVIKHGNSSIALISTDNQRISAQEQLATFGRILKIPTANVNSRNTLEMLLKKHSDKKLILIDTAGISNNDENLMKQLDRINACQRPVKKLLLMSATSQSAVLEQSVNIFKPFAFDALVLTKLDEAASLGEILSVVLKQKCPIIYTTDGQKVPEDIRLARSHHLISKAVWLANKYSRESEEWGLAQSIEQSKSA